MLYQAFILIRLEDFLWNVQNLKQQEKCEGKKKLNTNISVDKGISFSRQVSFRLPK